MLFLQLYLELLVRSTGPNIQYLYPNRSLHLSPHLLL